ncbi:hypothetical protein GCM10010415_05140 [Streptomyces atrovirens]
MEQHSGRQPSSTGTRNDSVFPDPVRPVGNESGPLRPEEGRGPQEESRRPYTAFFSGLTASKTIDFRLKSA